MKQKSKTIIQIGVLIIFLFTLSAGEVSAQDKCCGNKKLEKKLDKYPEPIGGLKAIMKNVKYPEEAKKAGIQGKVIVIALVDTEGEVITTKIGKSDNDSLNDAAINAVEKTKFTPAEDKGKKVKAEIAIPIMFKLN